MIVKDNKELDLLKKSGAIAKAAQKAGFDLVKPGITTLEIDKVIKGKIEEMGGKPAFLGYDAGDGSYPFSSCICLNHQLVHALPSDKVTIKRGDVVTIDLGVSYKGIITDTSHTIEVETDGEKFFLETGKKALKRSIKKAVVGNRVGDISYEMQSTVEKVGFKVSVHLVGHGVGKELHEPPQIPCFGKKNTGKKLIENQVLAIEIMYMKGANSLVMGEDGFSVDTKDNGLSAQFEHTIVVKEEKPLIIV